MFVDMTADIAHTLHPHRQLLVAFSGGLDSTVLLHQLVLLREQDPSLTLRAVHVHHGLSAHADDWVAHCRQICQQWQVPLVVHHVTLARGGLGVEAHARAARYQAFQDTLNAGEVLVTAQHQDDQCETLLLALKRGSGPTGLSAMAPSSAFAGSRLLRPLLNETRESLRQWALAHQLSWIEDESNQDDTYDRNFLRLRVIPVLRERWPHFSEAVARSASLCAEQEQLLDEMLAAELASLVAEDGSLAIAPLATMSPPRRAALLRRWLAGQQAPMPAREVPERLWHEVALAREDASPCLRLGEFTVRRFQQRLYWVKYLPGYGYAKASEEVKAKWGKMIENYLHTSKQLKAVFLLIDIRHDPSANDRMMYEWMVYQGFAPIIIATKLDKIKRSQIQKNVKAIREGLNVQPGTTIIPFSAETKQGRDEIWELIDSFVLPQEEK